MTITEKSGGSTSKSPNVSSILELLRDSRARFGRITRGTPTSSGVNNRFTFNPMPAGSLNDLARRGPAGTNPYERRAENREDQNVSDEKFNIINSSRGDLYYFELPNSDRKYRLSFNTVGNNDVEKLVYAFGLRGREGNELFLANQWHARTYNEAKDDAKNEIEQAKKRKNGTLGQNGKLSSVERDGATAKVDTYARQAIRDIDSADSFIKVDDALRQGLENINGVNPVGKELPKRAVSEAKTRKDQDISRNSNLTDTEKTEAKKEVANKAQAATNEINQASTDTAVEQAKQAGLNSITSYQSTPVKKPAAKNTVQQAAEAKKAGAKELPNTGTADSTAAMVAAAASALLGLGLAGRRRKEDEEA